MVLVKKKSRQKRPKQYDRNEPDRQADRAREIQKPRNRSKDNRSHAAPMARRCWKHSRQKTGRPCVGRKGTVVSFPHCEQLVLVSARMGAAPPPTASARLALQALQRLGSFLKPLSAKNICSPAVNTNSAPHSEHFKTLSWYSMEASPWTPGWVRERADFCTEGREKSDRDCLVQGLQTNTNYRFQTLDYEPETLNAANRGTGLGLLGLRARLCKLLSTVHYLTGA
jgi:hypothetical protein